MKQAQIWSLIIGIFASLLVYRILAQETQTFQTSEYGVIRWNGRENSFFIRPNGKVEMLGPLLTKAHRPPERVDERTFYMNIAINAVAREGFEFAGPTQDGFLMKRNIHQ